MGFEKSIMQFCDLTEVKRKIIRYCEKIFRFSWQSMWDFGCYPKKIL